MPAITRLAVVISAAATIAGLTLAGAARAELVLNGNFENLTPSPWLTQNGGFISDYGTATAQAHTGLRSAYFANSVGNNDQLYQNLPTTIGQAYTLSFWLFNPQQGSDHFRITWEGTQVFDQLPLTIPLSTWTQFSLIVTATQNNSQIRLWGYDIPDRLYVDDVSVTETPAPGAAGALLGLTGLAITRRRRAAVGGNS